MGQALDQPKQQVILDQDAFALYEQSELTGVVERTIFHNANNGFSILKIKLPDHKDEFGEPIAFIAKGSMPAVRVGDEYSFKGTWKVDRKYPQYGKQFVFTSFEMQMPTTKQGIITYLADVAHGVGSVKAKKLVAELETRFPEQNVMDLLQANPAMLNECKTITNGQAEQIINHVSQNTVLAELTALICRDGITPGLAGRIYSQYGPSSVDVVKENPYMLSDDMWGIGFKKADLVAQAVGIPKDSEFRLKAAIDYLLKEAGNDGHCYLQPRHIVAQLKDLLGFVPEIPAVKMANEKLIDEEKCVREGDSVYCLSLHLAECGVARHMLRLVGQKVPEIRNLDDLVNRAEDVIRKQEPFFNEYAPEQREAVKTVLQSGLSIITGGPGTGKTTVINGVIKAFRGLYSDNWKYPIYLCAPTGRAAKRMTETTGLEAKTIHRLLKYNPEFGGFVHDEKKQLKGPGLLIIDESSMMDMELANCLLQAIEDGIQVVMVGDIDQLPSVGPGSVLRDAILSEVIPTVRLNFNYRQAAGSGIATYAHMIGEGEWEPPSADDIEWIRLSDDIAASQASELAAQEVVKRVQQAVADGLGITDFQVLAPQRRGVAGVNNLNKLIRDAINPKTSRKPEFAGYRLGDKVMVTKNEYNLGVFNGDLGVVSSIASKDFKDLDDRTGQEIYGPGLFVSFDGEEVYFSAEHVGILDLAYATTIHKSQGSEFKLAIVTCLRSYFIMLARNLTYTGITRAKKNLVLIAQDSALKHAVKNNKIADRFSLLQQRLRGELESGS